MLDFNKYGFILKDEWGQGKTYTRNFTKDFFVELKVIRGKNCTIMTHNLLDDKHRTIAERYECETEEQFQFLLSSSSLGILFNTRNQNTNIILG
jgi:hypothetical protein